MKIGWQLSLENYRIRKLALARAYFFLLSCQIHNSNKHHTKWNVNLNLLKCITYWTKRIKLNWIIDQMMILVCIPHTNIHNWLGDQSQLVCRVAKINNVNFDSIMCFDVHLHRLNLAASFCFHFSICGQSRHTEKKNALRTGRIVHFPTPNTP